MMIDAILRTEFSMKEVFSSQNLSNITHGVIVEFIHMTIFTGYKITVETYKYRNALFLLEKHGKRLHHLSSIEIGAVKIIVTSSCTMSTY